MTRHHGPGGVPPGASGGLRHMVRPHQPRRTAPAATDKAMATAEVDMERTVSCPLASSRPAWGLLRVTDIRKSPDTRERISM